MIKKLYVFILLTLLLSTAKAKSACEKCNVEAIKSLHSRIDSLTFEVVDKFLCSFDSTCINNAEYSEWSNETLFIVIKSNPQLFIDIVTNGNSDQAQILRNIENPVIETDLQLIYDRIKSVTTLDTNKAKYLDAVLKAALASGQAIRR